MSKISATYNAPEFDAEVVTMRGVRFFDGQAVELDERQHSDLIEKLRTNQHFDVSDGGDFNSPAPLDDSEQKNGFSGASQGWNN